MHETLDHFEYERRFFCSRIPSSIVTEETPRLIVQSYYVTQDNYALRIRLMCTQSPVDMSADTLALSTLEKYRDHFTHAFMTVKGPSVGGTRYEAEKEINPDVAAALVMRGGRPIIKNRYNVWLGEDGWNIDVFGADNYPLIIAEAERRSPVTNLVIPSFCTTEITDQARFSNDGLANKPFAAWQNDFAQEIEQFGVFFLDSFGKNRTEVEEL